VKAALDTPSPCPKDIEGHAGITPEMMTYRASRLGARVVEVPITFRDRRLGQSKMSRRIIVEALFVVINLRCDELRGRGPVREPSGSVE